MLKDNSEVVFLYHSLP